MFHSKSPFSAQLVLTAALSPVLGCRTTAPTEDLTSAELSLLEQHGGERPSPDAAWDQLSLYESSMPFDRAPSQAILKAERARRAVEIAQPPCYEGLPNVSQQRSELKPLADQLLRLLPGVLRAVD